MGVPGLFAFLKRRYGVIARFITRKEDGTWDGATPVDALYVDMNHIIHSCTHANTGRDGTPYDEDAAFERMDAYLTALLEVASGGGADAALAATAAVSAAGSSVAVAAPRSPAIPSPQNVSSLRVLFVAIDGVAPIAKMNQQRTRRFLSAHVAEVTERVEREVRAEMASQASGTRLIPDMASGRFDPNIISPGTAFMGRVAERVRQILRTKVQTDPRFTHLRVIVSDSYEPAEGEHKIMRFIRHMRMRPEYDPNTRHMIYGQDADLLLLSLLLHEPHVRVLREGHPEQQPNIAAAAAAAKQAQQPRGAGWDARSRAAAPAGAGGTDSTSAPPAFTSTGAAPVAPAFEEVDISLLRECLQWEVAELCGAPDGRPLAAEFQGMEKEVVAEEEMEEEGEQVAKNEAEPEDKEEDKEEEAQLEMGGAAKAVTSEQYGAEGDAQHVEGPEAVEELALFEEDVIEHVVLQQVVLNDAQLPHGVYAGASQGPVAEAMVTRKAVVMMTQSGEQPAARSSTATTSAFTAAGAGGAVATSVATQVGAPGSDGGGDRSYRGDGDAQSTSSITVAVAAATVIAGRVATQMTGPSSSTPMAQPSPQPPQQEQRPQSLCPRMILPPALALALGPHQRSAIPVAAAPPLITSAGLQSPTTRQACSTVAPHSLATRFPEDESLPTSQSRESAWAAAARAPRVVTAITVSANVASAMAASPISRQRQCPSPPPSPPPPPPSPPPPPPELGSRELWSVAADITTQSKSKISGELLTSQQLSSAAAGSAAASAAGAAVPTAPKSTLSAGAGPGPATSPQGLRLSRGWWARSEFLDFHARSGGLYEGSQARHRTTERDSNGSRSAGRSSATAGGTTATPSAPRQLFDFEQILEDLVTLTFLAGNDFLPHVPSIDIYDLPSGLDLLLAAYKEILPQMKGYITQGSGQLNVTRLMHLFNRLAKDEEAAFLRRAEHRRRCHQRARDAAAASQSAFWDAAAAVLGPDGVSVGELPPGMDLDTVLSGLALSPDLAVALGLDWAVPSLDLTTATDQELRAELVKRVTTRTQERVMSGDPWAADPCGMGLPGYRARYYQTRFPEVSAGGDVDKIAALAVRGYMDGLAWVYRYYCLGPASLQFPDDDDSIIGGKAGRSGGEGCGSNSPDKAPEGASWTWAYPYHYAPLMQDLASSRIQALAFQGRRRSTLATGPIRMAREMVDMAYCSLDEWAPPSGPVRPLLQLLCILPPRSAMLALPTELASMLLIAHEMDDEYDNDDHDGEVGNGEGHHHHRHDHHNHSHRHSTVADVQEEDGKGWTKGVGGRGCSGGASCREPLQSRRRGRGGGGGGGDKARFSVLLTSAAEPQSESESSGSNDDGGGSSSDGEESPQLKQHQQWGRFGLPLADQRGGSWGLDGAGALSLHLLAQRVSRFFPNNIHPLVDLSGKKHLHTAIVRLPVVHPSLLAHVIQEGLRCGMQLSAEEKSRNRVLPSDLLVSESLYMAAKAAVGSGASADGITWHLLLQPVATISAPTTASPNAATPAPSQPQRGTNTTTTVSVTAVPVGPTTAVATRPPMLPQATATANWASGMTPIGGALGILLAARQGRLSTASPVGPASAATATFAAAAARSVSMLKLDVASLPVAATRASLLAGAQRPPLRVDRGSWRRLEAVSARGRSYAERVLGISKAGGAAGGRYGRGDGNKPAVQPNIETVGNSQEYMSYGNGSGFQGNAAQCFTGGQGGRGGRGRGSSRSRGFGAGATFSGDSETRGSSRAGRGSGRGFSSGNRGGAFAAGGVGSRGSGRAGSDPSFRQGQYRGNRGR